MKIRTYTSCAHCISDNSENTKCKAQYVFSRIVKNFEINKIVPDHFSIPLSIILNYLKNLENFSSGSFPDSRNGQITQNYFCVSFPGNLVRTSLRSAPILWLQLMLWLNFRGPTSRIIEKKPKFKDLKHKNIPELSDYSVIPESSYWENFPFKELPTRPTTKVDTVKLTELVHERKHLLKNSEWERGMKAVHNLK